MGRARPPPPPPPPTQFASTDLLLVFARCREPAGAEFSATSSALHDAGIPYMVYQKGGYCARAREGGAAIEAARNMSHNLGRECAVIMRFIVEHYDDLPKMTAFLQFGYEPHMPWRRELLPNLRWVQRNRSLGFAALSKNSFEGAFPAPCEKEEDQKAFGACAVAYWSAFTENGPEAGRPPPSYFRFYANNLFAASRERIRAHPLSLYRTLLARFEGRAPMLCRSGLHRKIIFWERSHMQLVPAEIDCLMLEKLVHVLFGEPALMPPQHEYNARTRFPSAVMTPAPLHPARNDAASLASSVAVGRQLRARPSGSVHASSTPRVTETRCPLPRRAGP